MTSQGPITFHDVAASFSEEQWIRLDNSQKEVYRSVMKDIHGTLMAQGYRIVNPSTVFSIKGRNESFVHMDSHSVEMKSYVIGDFPDILVTIKEEPIGETPISQGEHCFVDNYPSTCSPHKSNAALLKTEEEGFSIDDYNSAGGEGTPNNSAGVPGIFKQEPDHGDEGEIDNMDHENIIPVIVKEEEPDPDRNIHNQEIQPARHSANGGNGGGKHTTEKTGLQSVEAKKRRSGLQVHGDILSLEEREARRLRVLKGNINPFLQQNTFTFDPIRTASGIKVESADVTSQDIENTGWCKCGHCCQMSTVEESVCCLEISGMNYPPNDDCITLHPAFQKLCLEKDHLDFLYRFLGRMKRRNDIPYYLHKLRCMSYRAFVVWAHGFLDKRGCKPVPACVVKVVQELLPYPEELNVGYIKIYDYPAAIMALDHI